MTRFILFSFAVLLNFSSYAMSLEQKAQSGDTKSQLRLAMEYETGTNRSFDIDNAILWYIKAATQGDRTAQFNLGQLYINGYGIEQNPQKAIYWFIHSATQSHPPSQFYLGEIYEYGLLGEIDLNNASLWYQIAASNGHGEAMLGHSRVTALLAEHAKKAKIDQEKTNEAKIVPDAEVTSEPKTYIITKVEKPTTLITFSMYLLIVIMVVVLALLLHRLKQTLANSKKNDLSSSPFSQSLHNETIKHLQASNDELKTITLTQQATIERLNIELAQSRHTSLPFSHYQLLGITPNSTLAELKTQYRKLTQLYHPDHGSDGIMLTEIIKSYRHIKEHMLEKA